MRAHPKGLFKVTVIQERGPSHALWWDLDAEDGESYQIRTSGQAEIAKQLRAAAGGAGESGLVGCQVMIEVGGRYGEVTRVAPVGVKAKAEDFPAQKIARKEETRYERRPEDYRLF